MSEPLLLGRGLSKTFTWSAGLLSAPKRLRALDDVDVEIHPGECLALVGESGSGKTTLARVLMRLTAPDAGQVIFDGEDISALPSAALRRKRRDFQIVLQDVSASFDPRLRVGDSLSEPLRIHRLIPESAISGRVQELLETVGLNVSTVGRYPHQLSGGQLQRAAIARALATEPRLLLLDEPASALDVSVQAKILELLLDLKTRLGLTLGIIAHDLAMVEKIADRVTVMYLGKVVETAPREELYSAPHHPYSRALLTAVPSPDPQRAKHIEPLPGDVPSPSSPPPGCRFHPRCFAARKRCGFEEPALVGVGEKRQAACHFPLNLEPST